MSTTRHCIRCGKPDTDVDFPTATSLKCESCTDLQRQERAEYQTRYHKARHQAIQRLIRKHPGQFQTFLTEEKDRVDEEAEASGNGRRAKASV